VHQLELLRINNEWKPCAAEARQPIRNWWVHYDRIVRMTYHLYYGYGARKCISLPADRSVIMAPPSAVADAGMLTYGMVSGS